MHFKRLFFTLIFCLPFFNDHIAESRIVDTIEALQEKKIGNESAKIEMIEFASLTCGHCAKFHNEVFPKNKKRIYR